MSNNLSVDARRLPVPTEGADLTTKPPASEKTLSAKPIIAPRKIHAILAYYMLLLIIAIAAVVFILFQIELKQQPTAGDNLIAFLGFLTTGAIVGSVLYHIRALFRSYVKRNDFDPRWIGKYITGPFEAVGLALAMFSILQGGAIALGGSSVNVANGRPFTAFGFGALVGFGIREVVGWLASLAKSTFFTAPEEKDAGTKGA